MLFNWEFSDWIVFFVDIVALVIIVRFLSWKVNHKLNEVEQRQRFETRQRKLDRKNQPFTPEEE